MSLKSTNTQPVAMISTPSDEYIPYFGELSSHDIKGQYFQNDFQCPTYSLYVQRQFQEHLHEKGNTNPF